MYIFVIIKYWFRLYYAQCLFQSGLFEEAFNVTNEIDTSEPQAASNFKDKVLQLQSAIRYSSEDYAAAQSLLHLRQASHESTLNDEGCLLYQVSLHDLLPV